MVLDILKSAESTWREIVKLANPLDSDKEVVIGTKPKQGNFEAYTDNKKIYINVDDKKFGKTFEDAIIPAYSDSANKLYGISKAIPDRELFDNLVFDNFLFVHFHEQFHPWICPNSKDDERKISKALYDGIKEAEPYLSRLEAMMKVNNSKNLIWDIVLNVSFLSKTAGYNDEDLEQKIKYVFSKNERKIQMQQIEGYPKGIMPILYMISAKNRTTDIPISLVGGMYSTLSFNNPDMRKKALAFFLEDLESKKIPEAKTLDIIKKMYGGFVSKLDKEEMRKRGIDEDEFKKRMHYTYNITNPDYDENQRYFISSLTKIFDAPSLRYESLKGFVKVLSPYISLAEKQGSPDQNSGGNGDGEDNGESGKSQEEMDGDSMAQTLDDLLGELDKKEADGLMEEAANSDGCGTGGSAKTMRAINILSADEYYKRNADIIDIRNPSQEAVSFSIGNRKKWKLVHTDTMTSAEVSRLDHKKIINFQKASGLPVLMDAGNGFFRLNQYIQEEMQQKSYDFQKTGIEIPDNWVFFQDSSGTMTCDQSYIGSRNRFDLLNRVKYGLEKGLYQICKEMKKDLKFGIVNFSNITEYGGLDSLVKIYESRNHPVKEISLTPQCGATEINSRVFGKIKTDLAPGKSIYTFVTDGDLQGDTISLYREIENFSSQPNNAFVFVEIETNSIFGNEIKNLSKSRPSVTHYHVSDVKSIKDKLGSILIKYTK
ncbi:MAG: hypothetical protein WC475_03915 [Candidatus Paceibacterota bacterium]